MPVRTTEIPGLQSTRINAAPMDPDAAARPAEALGEIGRAIAGVSEPFARIALNIQEAANAEQLSKIRTGMDEARSKFLLDLEKDPDPASRLARTQEFLQKQKQVLDTPGLPRASRDKLAPWVDEWAGTTNISVAKNAADLQMRRTDARTANEIAAAREARDPARVQLAINERVSAGLITPEQGEAERSRIGKVLENDAVNDRIAADPGGWLRNPVKSGDAVLDEQRMDFARGKQRAHTILMTEDILDQIYGNQFSSGGHVDYETQASGLPPRVQAELRAVYESRATAARRAEQESPAGQAKIVGEVSVLMDGYSPTGEGYDSDYVRIDGMIRSLPEDSAIRAELGKQLDAVREGARLQVKTHADEAYRALEEAYRSNRFGDTSGVAKRGSMSLGKAVDDGLLKDRTKLGAFFPPEVAEAIADGGTMGATREHANAARAARFREELGKLPPEKQEEAMAKLSPMDRALFSAVRDRTPLADVVRVAADPEEEDAAISARDAARAKYGEAKMKLADFLRVRPRATEVEIGTKILEWAGEDSRRKYASGRYGEPEPPEKAGADPSTSAIPQGGDLRSVVRHFEAGGARGGFHRKAYWDEKQWSIGYGTRSREGEVIDEAEAGRRLDAELAAHRKRVETISARLGLTFNEHEKDALTSFDYNTGRLENLLAGGRRKKEEIADKMLLYRNAGGQRLPGLERRRRAEREIFLRGYA